MTIYLYKDGLVRLASEKYDPNKNFNDPYTHLTNYSLNKKNENFDNDAHKLRLNDCLKGIMSSPPVKKGRPGVTKSAAEIWDEIEAIVVKTIITVQPQLQHIYRSCQTKEPDCCFELLGFDIMLDHKLRPWMLEVNHTPSFNADTSVDETVKQGLLKNTLEIISMSVEHRKRVAVELKQEMKQQIQQNNYKRPTALEHSQRVRFDHTQVEAMLGSANKFKLIYPKEAPGADPDLYIKFQQKANEIWRALTGTKQNLNARREMQEKEEKPKKPKKKKKKALPKETGDTACTKPGEDATEQDQKGSEALQASVKSKRQSPSASQAPISLDKREQKQSAGLVQDYENEGVSRNFSKELDKVQKDEFLPRETRLEGVKHLDSDSIQQYNFLEKKDHQLYKSMQKTLKSDKDFEGTTLTS